jgi:peptidoglycan/LPS O-acetylase OafA/YrhL
VTYTLTIPPFLPPSLPPASAKVNGHDGKGFLATYPAQSVTGGYFAVDTFFFLSAFLAVFFMLEEIKKLQV